MKINIPSIEYVNIVKHYFNIDDIKVIFEIGSMDGKDSLLFREHFPNSLIYAFEGLPSNYEMFLKNLPSINTYNKVIFNYDGKIIFNEKNTNGIHGVFDRGQEYGQKTITTVCCRIDTFCRQNNIEKIDMVKIDVEGATYEVLESFGTLLQKAKVMHIETEDYPFFKGQQLDNAVDRLLRENNFELLDKAGCMIGNTGKQYDSIWINKNECTKTSTNSL